MINQFVFSMVVSVVIASISQILLKKSTFHKYSSVLKEYLNPYVMGGYALLVLSMLLTVYAYSGMEYKNGPVIEAFGNVLVLILSYVFFGERISLRKIIGMVFIVGGIVIFNL